MNAGTIEPISVRDIFTKNRIFCCTPAFQNTTKAHNDIKFGKEVKTFIVVDRRENIMYLKIKLTGSWQQFSFISYSIYKLRRARFFE